MLLLRDPASSLDAFEIYLPGTLAGLCNLQGHCWPAQPIPDSFAISPQSLPKGLVGNQDFSLKFDILDSEQIGN
jgi:hypothetical protein